MAQSPVNPTTPAPAPVGDPVGNQAGSQAPKLAPAPQVPAPPAAPAPLSVPMPPQPPNIEKTETPDDYDRIVRKAQRILAALPKIDYQARYAELSRLNVPTRPNATIQQLNLDMQRIQSAKDRLAEMSVAAMRNAQTWDMIASLLRDGWAKFSDESAVDKRKGEAVLKAHEFLHEAAEADSYNRSVNMISKNLESKHLTVSRQISCFDLMLKLRDISRALPEESMFSEVTEPEDEKKLQSEAGNSGRVV